jgi:hypothetical protein
MSYTFLFDSFGLQSPYLKHFKNILRSPGIDSQPGGPVRQPCLTYRQASGGIDSFESIPGLRKRLQIRSSGSDNQVLIIKPVVRFLEMID